MAHHVVHRGINRQPVFRDDRDRHVFLNLLAKSADKFKLSVWSYCLMDNHFHLFLDDPYEKLSEMLHSLNGVYTTKFNLRHQCEGALLRGRFFSKPVTDDEYKIILFRYIHLNPVKAGMVSSPCEYRWSSYNVFTGLAEPFFVFPEPLLRLLGAGGITAETLDHWILEPESKLGLDERKIVLAPFGRKKEKTHSAHESQKLSAQQGRQDKEDDRAAGPAEDFLNTFPQCAEGDWAAAKALILRAAKRYGLDSRSLLRPKKGARGISIKARSEALVACRLDAKLSHKTIANLFGLAVRSTGPALARAKRQIRIEARKQADLEND